MSAPTQLLSPAPALPRWMGVSGFVDLHCHILPGVDDGPKSEQDAAALLEQAYLAGTAAMAATSHFNFQYGFDPARVAQLLDVLERRLTATPVLFPGCELELNDEALRAFFAAPCNYTLNGSRYALVEPPLRFPPESMPWLLQRFREAEVTPILAHPERSRLFQTQPKLAAAWAAGAVCCRSPARRCSGAWADAPRLWPGSWSKRAWRIACRAMRTTWRSAQPICDRPS
ncbi:MAG: CpsB/CapC family capsule biosynthesis tyrosine phosphatase [Bryobacterales bacterium]